MTTVGKLMSNLIIQTKLLIISGEVRERIIDPNHGYTVARYVSDVIHPLISPFLG